MKCFECDNVAIYDHHVVPKSKGGKRKVPLCGKCHSWVHGPGCLSVSELTKKGLAHKRSNGEKTGGDIPFGFDLKINPMSGKKMLVTNPQEQDALRFMKKQRGKGLSLRGIIRHLEDRGIRTKRGQINWHPQSVKQILFRARGVD